MPENTKQNQINWLLIILNLILIIALLFIFDYSNIDLALQKYLFNFESKKWLVDKEEPIAKFFFYQAPKVLLGILMIFCLFLLAKKRSFPIINLNKHQIILLFLGITLIPLTVGNIKKFTNVYCPNQLEIYNGDYPYVKVLEPYPASFLQSKKGKCFPAGHAVTGFCLMILFFVFKEREKRIKGLIFGVALGWIIGFYQMAKGAHFFSDTVISMLMCFLVATIIDLIFKKWRY